MQPFVDGLRLLQARVRLVVSRLVLIFVLPLDFHGRVRDRPFHVFACCFAWGQTALFACF